MSEPLQMKHDWCLPPQGNPVADSIVAAIYKSRTCQEMKLFGLTQVKRSGPQSQLLAAVLSHGRLSNKQKSNT